MYKLSEEEYNVIGLMYDDPVLLDYTDWYLAMWCMSSDALRLVVDDRNTLSEYSRALLDAEDAKEIREKVRLLQEALDV